MAKTKKLGEYSKAVKEILDRQKPTTPEEFTKQTRARLESQRKHDREHPKPEPEQPPSWTGSVKPEKGEPTLH